MGLTAMAVVVLRRRDPAAPAPTAGYPVTPADFIALVVVLLTLLAARHPFQALLGVAGGRRSAGLPSGVSTGSCSAWR